jgi:hypothetical protein
VVAAIGSRVDRDHTRRLGVVDVIEKQQLDPGRMLREYAEVHSAATGRRPQRRAVSSAGVLGRGKSNRIATC